jgi:hypothetical protein
MLLVCNREASPFRSWSDKLTILSKIEGRSMVLCLGGHHPVLSMGANARR